MKTGVVVTKNGRGRCLEGVMANAGVPQGMVITRDGFKIHVPASCIYQKSSRYYGQVKKHILAKLQDLSLENAIALNEEHGIVLEKVNAVLTHVPGVVPFQPNSNPTHEEMFA